MVSRLPAFLLNLPFWGPVPCAFTPHGGSPETVPATSIDTQALYGLECRWLADSALQWKSARIPWFERIQEKGSARHRDAGSSSRGGGWRGS